jgi:hypothetical protein
VYEELFRIRPFLEILRLVRDLDGLSKAELALFGVPLIDHRDYDAARDGILSFRQAYARISGTRPRKEYVAKRAMDLFLIYYLDDIAVGRVGRREARGAPATAESMLRRKIDNARDYADAAIRYFRATGLFTVTARASRLDVLPERRHEADAILTTFQRDPVRFEDEEGFYSWLGDPTQPTLPSDDKVTLEAQIRLLYQTLPHPAQKLFALDLEQRLAGRGPVELKRDYVDLVARAAEEAIRQQRRALAGQDVVDEIVDMFQRIRNADAEIIDRPLFFEWNTWRALAMLDDGDVRHNFTVDQTGQPLSPAPGRGGDIECTYRECHILVEVTLTAGQTQYMREGEPVNRHVGLLQARLVDAGDNRPVYGLFIAPTINPTVLAHFWQLHLHPRPTAEFRGHVRVIPVWPWMTSSRCWRWPDRGSRSKRLTSPGSVPQSVTSRSAQRTSVRGIRPSEISPVRGSTGTSPHSEAPGDCRPTSCWPSSTRLGDRLADRVDREAAKALRRLSRTDRERILAAVERLPDQATSSSWSACPAWIDSGWATGG